MKYHKKYCWVIAFSAVLFSACSEFIEPSINSSKVYLEAPGNNYPSTSYTMNFWWDQVDNALSYRLQIVSPRFDSVAYLVTDTLIKKNTFVLTMNPGKYQWRVRAENGSSQSPYAESRSFTVLYSSIKQQSVLLSSPANGLITNQSPVTLQWTSVYGATKYQLEIDTNNFVNESAVLLNQVYPGLQVNYTFPKDQTYQWRVRAQNDTAQAKWSAINTISYNRTPPGMVTLIAPINKQTVGSPVSLQWNSTSKAVKYKVYVLKSDSTTLYNAGFPAVTTATNYSFNLGATGEHVYWKVTAIDAAGNEGLPSVLRSFILQ
ncbi:hypothetical protein ACFGVR_15440 [Mucilaginibacter sp. AW1-3]